MHKTLPGGIHSCFQHCILQESPAERRLLQANPYPKNLWGQPLQNPAALPFCFHLSTKSLRQVRRFQTLDKNLVTGCFLLLDQPFESIQMVLNFFNFTSQFGGIILVGFFNLFRRMDENSNVFNSSCQVTTCSGQL